MKNLMLCLSVIGFFMACQKGQEAKIDTQVVPDIVMKAITSNFTDATNISFTTLKKNELFGADFKSSQKQYTAVVGANGNIKEYSIQATSVNLPTTITTSINATYPNATINSSYSKYNNLKVQDGYFVQITTATSKRLELSFDLIGALISTIEMSAASVMSKYAINKFEDLPENIRNYLTNRHTGLVFSYGAGVVVDNVTTFYVMVKLGDVLHNYSFNSNAVVLTYSTSSLVNSGGTSTSSQKSLTSATEVPPVIATYLNAHFVGWKFLKGLAMYENNALASYIIVVQVNADIYYIYFDAAGGFTGAKKG